MRTTSTNSIIQSQSQSSGMDVSEKDNVNSKNKLNGREMEERLCSLCGYIRVAPAAPPLRDWCKSWKDSTTTTQVLNQNAKKRNRRKRRPKQQQQQQQQQQDNISNRGVVISESDDQEDEVIQLLENISIHQQNSYLHHTQ
jgi:hypothetical protein